MGINAPIYGIQKRHDTSPTRHFPTDSTPIPFSHTWNRSPRRRHASVRHSGNAEIRDFGHHVLVQQHVLRLQVAVHHCVLTRVQELHAFGDLRVRSDEPEMRGTVRLIVSASVCECEKNTKCVDASTQKMPQEQTEVAGDLQDPLLPLQDRHLGDRFGDVQRNVLVHAKFHNLGSSWRHLPLNLQSRQRKKTLQS